MSTVYPQTSFVQYKGVSHQDRYSNLGPGTKQTFVSDAGRLSSTRTSTVTPNYRKLIKVTRKRTGVDLPMNPFTYDKLRDNGIFGSDYTLNQKISDGGKTWDDVLTWGCRGNAGDPFGPAAAVFTALTAKAQRKMLGKFKDQTVNLGWALGESRQTKNLLVNTARKLANAAFALRRGNIAGAANVLLGVNKTATSPNKSFLKDLRKNGPKALASGWLELQYGWKPLLADVHGSAEFLANRLYRLPRYKESYTARAPVENIKSADSVGTDFTSWNTYTREYTVKYIIYYQQSGNHDLSSLGLTNPLSIAWEVTPFSFVVDWMLPIGDWLNNLDATDGLSFVKGCKTNFFRGTVAGHRRGNNYVAAGFKTTNISSWKSSSERIIVDRSKLTSFPSSPLPSPKNPFSQYKGLLDPGDHVLNSLALMAQAFKSPSSLADLLNTGLKRH